MLLVVHRRRDDLAGIRHRAEQRDAGERYARRACSKVPTRSMTDGRFAMNRSYAGSGYLQAGSTSSAGVTSLTSDPSTTPRRPSPNRQSLIGTASVLAPPAGLSTADGSVSGDDVHHGNHAVSQHARRPACADSRHGGPWTLADAGRLQTRDCLSEGGRRRPGGGADRPAGDRVRARLPAGSEPGYRRRRRHRRGLRERRDLERLYVRRARGRGAVRHPVRAHEHHHRLHDSAPDVSRAPGLLRAGPDPGPARRRNAAHADHGHDRSRRREA